ncbi:MAG: TonB-dependent receptor [Candidatus Aminicenantales bacterium]|jgi:iron complex outermembrane receptor protein
MKRPVSSPLAILALVLVAFGLCLSPIVLAGQEQTPEKTKKEQEKEQEKPVRITEEIQVIGKAPREIPLATVTTIEATTIQQLRPLDLSEVLNYAPGATVTLGGKGEYTLKLRGIDSGRIALLVDGVPIVEPYFGTFDLKTVSTGGVQSMQITKGPSSVLYGPNTLGGIVNVITRRPTSDPRVYLTLAMGNQNTRGAGADTALQLGKVGVVASALYQDSGGFRYTDPSGVKQDRLLSDYQRFNLSGKVIYNPSSTSEIMINADRYHSAYGIPPTLFGRARYWRFKDWDRTSVSAGGYTSIGDKAFVRFRGYYVSYYNVLDQYANGSMAALSAESTYDNPIYGFFGLGEYSPASWNSLKASVYYEADKTRQQDDTALPWYGYQQKMFSVGLEDHISFLEDWKLIVGASVDSLRKFIGGTTTKVNPLVGLKYSPIDALDIHISYATKSKFPSMRSLYSFSSGNPDLKSEFGRSFELSATYNKGFFLTGSFFLNTLRDFINTVLLPDGTRRYYNINKARINGFELQAQRAWTCGGFGLDTLLNYTFLDHRDETDNRPLDALPKHNGTFEVGFRALSRLRLGLTGILASESWYWNSSTSALLTIPSYFSLDAVLSYAVGDFEPFIRVTNVFNHYFYTELGFPWRGRFLEVGLKAGLF